MEEIRYRSTDDLEIQGWIVKPPDFDPKKKYPLILRIHGGPHAMYNVGFNFEMQNHAANGYLCLYTNPRGSTGYGKEFGNAINNAYPGKDYDDLMRGVDEVIKRGQSTIAWVNESVVALGLSKERVREKFVSRCGRRDSTKFQWCS